MEPGEAGESRNRMITEATRQALIQEARRARRNLPLGVALVLVGAAIATAVWKVTAGHVPGVVTIIGGGTGLMMIPFGIAVLAQSARTISTSRRGVRELEASLPVARIQK